MQLILPTQLRWNILLNFLLWILLPLPVWLPFLHPYIPINWSLTTLFTIQGVFNLCWLVVALLSIITYFRIFLARNQAVSEKKFTHLVCMATYKEPLDLLITTIQSLAKQTVVENTVMTVGFEERTPDREIKEVRIRHDVILDHCLKK